MHGTFYGLMLMLCGTPWRKITNRPWVGEGPGERLRSPVGPGQRPSKGPRGRRPPEALGVWGITEIYLNDNFEPTTPFLSDLTDRSRYVNPSKNYWFSFSSFIISLIGLYFRCLYFREVLVNTSRPDGVILFVVWITLWWPRGNFIVGLHRNQHNFNL